MKNVACIIARTNSSRLPQKVLLDVNGIRFIEYLIQKVKRSKLLDEIYLCTSVDDSDKILLDIAEKNGIKSYAGSRESVIDRMLDVAKSENADNVIRITGDNIFTDEVYLDLMLKYHQLNNSDYTRSEYLTVGITAEVINVKALKKCYDNMDPNESQYLMLYMFQPDIFDCQVLVPDKKHNKSGMTFTVDTPTDFNRTTQIIEHSNNLLNIDEILEICSKHKIPDVLYKAGFSVKFPANLSMTFKAFRTEMEMRIEKSKQIYLEPGEYLQMFNSLK